MKIRPVTCIHVAAYLFSALVLACSAFSYDRAWDLQWTAGTKLNWIVLDDGQLCVTELYDWPWKERLRFTNGLSRSEMDEVFIDFSATQFDLLGFKRCTGSYWIVRNLASTDRKPNFVRAFFAPISAFLLGPIAWLCSFYLFKLRQRFRKRSVSFQPGAPCVPSE